jgi:hypothetical protein
LVNDCTFEGTCSAGVCTCNAGFIGPNCNIACNGNGQYSADTRTCTCNAGYDPSSYCATLLPAPAAAASNGGAVAAGILIPLALVAAAAGGFVWWRRANPYMPLSSLLPSFLVGRGGALSATVPVKYSALASPAVSSASAARNTLLSAGYGSVK